MERFADPFLEPGALVRHPTHADWGLRQVQSVTGRKAMVNFEHAGNQTIDAGVVSLVFVGEDPRTN